MKGVVRGALLRRTRDRGWNLKRYGLHSGMILRFRHKGLKLLYEDDNARSVQAAHADRLRRILTNLDVATQPKDLDLPGYRLHRLKGERAGEWSVTVSGNWRITFRFDGQDVTDIDFEDYH